MDLNEFSALFSMEWERNKDSADYSKMPEPNARLACWEYLQVYYKERLKLLNPLNKEAIEIFLKFKIRNKDREMLITGKCDMIDKSGWLIDHKTSGREKKQEDYSNDPQAFIYPVGLIQMGYDIKGTQFSIAGKKKCQAFNVPFDKVRANAILAECLRYQEDFENENFLRARYPHICRFCEWSSICPDRLT